MDRLERDDCVDEKPTGAPLPGNSWRALSASDNETLSFPLSLGILLGAVAFVGLILVVFLLIPK
jgi:hypothetical protein